MNIVKTLTALGMLASVSAQAAGTGNLLLQGTVTIVNDIVITANANATNLNILGGETNKLVATVDETSNNLNGYKIQMLSANSSKLVLSTDSSKSTTYTVAYDGGAPVSLTGTAQTVKNVGSLSGLATDTSNVNVNVTAAPNATAGTYEDTITISIVAN